MQGVRFEDAIARSAYPVDIHSPSGWLTSPSRPGALHIPTLPDPQGARRTS